jgi:hypothetical protein
VLRQLKKRQGSLGLSFSYLTERYSSTLLFFSCSEGLPPLCTTPEKRQGSLGLPISRKIIFDRVKLLYTMLFLANSGEKKRKVQRDLLGKMGPTCQIMREKKSKVAIFREYVPTIHQFIRGILSFSTSPFDLKPNLVILFWMITN